MAYMGRLAIVAGGLGGLGSSTALLLHSQGCSLALLYAPFEASRKDSILESVFGISPSSSSSTTTSTPSTTTPKITTHECDITSETSVAQAFTSILSDHDTTSTTPASFPSILINAAGYVTVAPMELTTVAEATLNLTTNVMGPFIVSKAFYEIYKSHVIRLLSSSSSTTSTTPSSTTPVSIPPARIVSISSQASHVALPGHSAYCASKAALNALTRSMATEWAVTTRSFGGSLTANTVSPTVVLTALGRAAWSDEDKREAMVSAIPAGRFAEPEEIAGAIEFLCRDGSGMVNGADVRVDGGFTVQ